MRVLYHIGALQRINGSETFLVLSKAKCSDDETQDTFGIDKNMRLFVEFGNE